MDVGLRRPSMAAECMWATCQMLEEATLGSTSVMLQSIKRINQPHISTSGMCGEARGRISGLAFF